MSHSQIIVNKQMKKHRFTLCINVKQVFSNLENVFHQGCQNALGKKRMLLYCILFYYFYFCHIH